MKLPKPRKIIAEKYVAGLSLFKSRRSPIKLSANESALGPSPKAVKSYSSIGKGFVRYPDSDGTFFRKVLAKKFKIKRERIILGSGSDQIFELVCKLFLNKGDEVIVPEYSFIIYRIYSRMFGAKVRYAKEENFKASVTSILNCVNKKTKIVFLANPNNPTGTYLTKFELIELRKKLRKNILLVVDDAYAEYMKNSDYKSGLELFKNKHNVFILRTFSKIYGLSSLRIGWGYGSKKIVDALNIIKPPFNVNEVAQKAAQETLKDTKFLKRSIKHNVIYATKLKNFLDNYDISSNKVSANFLLLDFKKCKIKAKIFYEKLKKKGIILRSTEDGYRMKNMLRLTIGSKSDNLRFIKSVKGIFGKWKIYW